MKTWKKLKKEVFDHPYTRDLILNSVLNYEETFYIRPKKESEDYTDNPEYKIDRISVFKALKRVFYPPEFLNRADLYDENGVPKIAIHLMGVFYRIIGFVQEGCMIIKLKSDDLIFALENTSIGNICPSEITVPSNFFYVSTQKKYAFEEGEIYFDGACVHKTSTGINVMLLYSINDIFLQKAVTFKYDENLEDAADSLSLISPDKYQEKMKSIFLNMFRLVFKIIILYNVAISKNSKTVTMRESNNLIKNISINSMFTSTKKAKESSKILSDANYYYLLDNNSEQSRTYVNNKGYTIDKKFIVSGHYRKQPYGSKSDIEYKIIWIEPYIKGINSSIIDDPKIKINVI